MNTAIGDKLWQDWLAVRHPGQHPASPQGQPQETRMTTTKLSAARDAISAIADNPLIDAIAEAGIGKWMTAAEVQNLVSLWREVENGRRPASPAAPPAMAAQLAASLTPPQQTA